MNRSWQWAWAGVLVAVIGSYAFYTLTRPEPLPDGILYGSGHIEGTEIRIASEVAGRVVEHWMPEGSNRGEAVLTLSRQPQVAAIDGVTCV